MPRRSVLLRAPLVRAGCAVLLLIAARAVAQDAPPAPPTTLGPPAPAAVPPHDITARAEQALREAADIEVRHAAGTPPRTLQAEVTELADRVRRLTPDRRRAVAALTPRDVEDLEREWLRIQEDLHERADLVARRLQAIDGGLVRLRELADVWRVTADSARAADLPEAVLGTIADVQQGVEAAERQLIADRDALLAVAAQIAPLQQRVSDQLATVRGLAVRVRGELFTIQAPPLWTALLALGDESPWTAIRTTGERDFQLLRAYLGGGRLAVRVVLLVVVLALGLDLRRRIPGWPPDDAEALGRAQRIAARPVASGVLMALVVGTILFPTDPVIVTEASILVALLPLHLLVRERLAGRLRTLVPALAATFVLAMLRRQLPPTSAWGRLLLCVEGVLGLGWLVWAFARAPGGPGAYGLRAARAAWVAGAVFATALVANVAGAVVLGVLLVQSIVASVVFALGLWATSDVVEGLIVAGLRPWRRYPLRAVATHVVEIRMWAVRLVRLGAVVVWLVGTLLLFGIHRDAADVLRRVLDASLTVGSLHLSVQGVVVFVVSVWLAVVTAGAVRALLEEDVFVRMPLPRGVPSAISAAANYAVLFVGILLAMSAAGVALERVTLLAGAVGVGIGFGLQNVVNNFVSGLILLVERPMRIGDVVEIGPTVGTVRRIGIRSSTLRTFDGAEVIVPNGTLIAERLTNWTFSDYQRRVEVRVAVASGADPEAVAALLVQAARRDDVLPHPAPDALLVGVGDGKLTFVLRAWSPTYEQAPEVQSRLTAAVYAALRAADVELR